MFKVERRMLGWLLLLVIVAGAAQEYGYMRGIQAAPPLMMFDGTDADIPGTADVGTLDADTIIDAGMTSGRVAKWDAAGLLNEASDPLSDAFNNPESEADYVVWVDAGVYYAKNGHTGEVTNNANATTLIQGLINSLEGVDKGGKIFLKNGVYQLNSITIEKDDISICGENRYNTKLNFASGQNGITIGDGVNRIYYVNLIDLSIIYQGSSTDDKIGVLFNSPSGCKIDNVYINLFYKGIYVQNDVGFSGYNVFNQVTIAGTTFGFYSTGIKYFNGNIFNRLQVSGSAGPAAGGIGFRLINGYNNQINLCLFEVWETAIKLETTESDSNTFIAAYFDAVTNGIDFASAGKRNTFIGGDFRSCTNKIINDYNGSRNVFFNMRLYVTESTVSATIASGATSVVVNHGLSYTPSAANTEISVMYLENPTNDPGPWYVDTFTATQCTIHVLRDPGASNLDIQVHFRRNP